MTAIPWVAALFGTWLIPRYSDRTGERRNIAALTLPKANAESTAVKLVSLGVTAIWNFAHVDLDLSDKSVVVENVHLSDSLMQLSYNIVKNSK